jgi:multicomponent Na+:H+ antiporter subunit F
MDGAMALLVLALGLSGLRLLRGPTLADRVLALEASAALLAGLLAAAAVRQGTTELLDVAMVLAVAGFLGTVAFARYLERRGRGDGR